MRNGIMMFGDYRPVRTMYNGIQIAGYQHSEQSGEGPFAWDGTYNDTLTGMIGGKSVQAAEYVVRDGESGQVQTVQGKNLLSLYSNKIYNPGPGVSANQDNGTSQAIYRDYDIIYGATRNGYISTSNATIYNYNPETNSVTVLMVSGGYGLGIKIKASPNTTYAKNAAINGMGCYDASGNLLSHGTATTITTPANTAFIIAVYAPSTINKITTRDYGQVEIGSTATAYEPFVPNSPSPDYQSPITTNIPAGTYKITLPNGEIYEFSLSDDVRGLTGAQDRVVFDRRSKKGWLDTRCGKYILTGVSPFIVAKNDRNAISYAYYRSIPDKTNTSLGICTHFKHATLNLTSAGQGTFTCNSTYSPQIIYYNFYGIVTKNNAEQPNAYEANAWLAAQYAAGTPVTVIYQLATPVRTSIVFTKVTSSTAPEFPASALTVTDPSPDYPLPIYDAAGTATASGRNLFDKSLPLARTIGAAKTETATGIRMTTTSPGSDLYGYINLGKIKFYAGLTMRLRSDVSSSINGQPGAIGLRYSDNINFSPELKLASNINATQINITFTISLSYASSEGYLGLSVNASRLAESVKGDWLQYDNLQLEPGSTAHPYLPYRAPSSLTFALPGIPLQESATEWTYIDAAGQKWWADTEEWGKFDGVWRWRRTERIYPRHLKDLSWGDTQYATYGIFHVPSLNPPSPTYTQIGTGRNVICTHFGASNTGWTSLVANTIQVPSNIYSSSSYMVCKPVIDGVTDLTTWRAWLTANDPIIYYIRRVPVITYHDDPPLRTYPRYTHVEQDGDVKAYLSLDAKVIDY